MGVAGPMARTVEDVALLFNALAGPDARDPYSHEPAPPATPDGKPRIAVLRQPGAVPVQSRCSDAVDRAASLFAAEGYVVEEFDYGLLDGAFEMWRFLFIDWTAPGVRGFINGRERDCSWTGLELLSLVQGCAAPARDQLDSVLSRQAAMCRAVAAWMSGGILLLMPGFGTTAFPHRQSRFETPAGAIDLLDAVRTVAPANVLGLPSLAVPVLAGDGEAPAGIQIMGPPDAEELLLDVGRVLEDARGPLPSPPLS
jgi:Asp-tRNA(Asn)/Glu-tRNA(Gln) amidotransferase A subunit family amidase